MVFSIRKTPKWYLRDWSGIEDVGKRVETFVAEVKNADTKLSPALGHFQGLTGAKHAFHVVMERPYENVDCFGGKGPVVVSARTLTGS